MLSNTVLVSYREVAPKYLISDNGDLASDVLKYSNSVSVSLDCADSSNHKNLLERIKEQIQNDPELYYKLSYK